MTSVPSARKNCPPQGESHNKAKLTLKQVAEIRATWAATPKKWGLLSALGRRYGVAPSNIQRIIRGDCWRDSATEPGDRSLLMKPRGERYVVTCEACGAELVTTPGVHRRFCNLRCFGRWQSEHVVGDAHPTKGRKMPNPARFTGVTLVCPVCETPFYVKAKHAPKRRCCSRKCGGVWQSRHNTGENNSHWVGGYDPYYGPSWIAARRAVLERDPVCRDCGKSPGELPWPLEVHHITPFRLFGIERHAEANDLGNLMALCKPCHIKRDWRDNGPRKHVP